MTRPINGKMIESVIKIPPQRKALDSPDCFIDEFYQIFEEELSAVLFKLFQKY